MAAFNLTAQLNITGPNNLKPVISNLRKQLGTVNGNVNIQINPNIASAASGLNSSLKSLDSTLKSINSSASSASSAFRQLGAAIGSVNMKSVPKDLAAVTQESQKIQTQQVKTSAAIKQSTNSMVEFGKQSALAIRRFAAFSLVTGVIFKFTNALGNASTEFMKFNKQLVQLSQVTGTSLQGLSGLEQTITALSTSLGVSSSSLIDVSSTLAQAGLTANETEEALKALAKSVLAPSFGNLNETVEGSIALMRQFSISTAQLEAALGSINSVAAKFAVEADDIIVAIQRTGGVFAAASKGVVDSSEALNQFIALFTSVRATTRESAETIATGLRTIFTRIQRKDTIELLKQYGIQLTDLEGKFVGPYEAVKRLSRGLAGLDTRDIRFSSIIEELGGFRQVGKVIPLLQQFSTAERALLTAQRGQGSLTADAAKAQQALAIQMAKVQEEFIALVRSIGSSNQFQTMVKVALDLASALITVADASKHAMPAIAGLLAVKGTIGAFRFASGFASGMRRGNTGPAAGAGTRMSGAPRGYAQGGQVPVALEAGEMVFSGPEAVRKAGGAAALLRFNRTGKKPDTLNRAGGGGVFMVPGSGRGDNFKTTLPEGSIVIKRQSVRSAFDQMAAEGGEIRQHFLYGTSRPVKRKSKTRFEERTQKTHIGPKVPLTDEEIEIARAMGTGKTPVIKGRTERQINFQPHLLALDNQRLRRGTSRNTGKSVEDMLKFVKSRSPEQLFGNKGIPKEIYKYLLQEKKLGGLKKALVRGIASADSTLGGWIDNDKQLDFILPEYIKPFLRNIKIGKGRSLWDEMIKHQALTTSRISPQERKMGLRTTLPSMKQEMAQKFGETFALGGMIQRLSNGTDEPLKFPGRKALLDALGGARSASSAIGGRDAWKLLGLQGAKAGTLSGQNKADYDKLMQEYGKSVRGQITKKAQAQKLAATREFAVLGLRGESSTSQEKTPLLKSKTKGRFKPKDVTVHKGVLPSFLSKRLEAIARKGYRETVAQMAALLADRAGTPAVSDKKALNNIIKKTFQGGGLGQMLEASVAAADSRSLYPTGRINTPMDFPKGSGVAGLFLGSDGKPVKSNIPSDITVDTTESKTAQMARFLRDRKTRRTKRSALGGMIQRLATGGKVSRKVDFEKGVAALRSTTPSNSQDSALYGLLVKSGLPNWQYGQIINFLKTNKYSLSEANQYIERRKKEQQDKLAAKTNIQQLTESLKVQTPQASEKQKQLAQTLMHRYNGGEIPFQPEQLFSRGSKSPLLRKMGIIDSDQLRSSERARKAMRELGFHNPDKDTYDVDGYKKLLSQTAISKRSEGALKKLVTIAGSPGAGKSSFAEGNEKTAISDNATLRKTTRSFIETPDDFNGLSEVRDTTATMTLEKLAMAQKSDRVVALSSSTKDELNILKQQLKHRTATGQKQYGRTHTISAQDSGELEAMLSMGIDPKKLITLGLMPGFKKRRKRSSELPYVTEEKVDITKGAYAPMTQKGHIEGLIDQTSQKKLIIVGSNEGYNPKDAHSLRTAAFDQNFRAKIAEASVPDAYVSKAGKGFTLPEIHEVQRGQDGRRHFVRPAKGSRAFVGDEGKDLATYEKAGLKTVVVPRPQGSESGTATRARIASGDFSGLHPNAEKLVRGAASSIRNREAITPRLYEKAEKRALTKIAAIDKELSKYPARLSAAYKKQNPDVAETVEKLRGEKTKIKSAISMSHHKMLARLAKRYPSIYGYPSSDSSKTMQDMIKSGTIRASQQADIAIAGRFAIGGNVPRSARIMRKPSYSAISLPKPQSGYDQIRSIENQIAELNNRRTTLVSHTKTSFFGNKTNPYQREIFDLEDEIARLSQVKHRLSQQSRPSNVVPSTKTAVKAVTPTRKLVPATAVTRPTKPSIATIKQPIIQSKTDPKPGSISIVLNRQKKAELSQTIKRLNAEIKEADDRISGLRSHDIKPGFFGRLTGESTKNPYQQELWDEEERKSRAQTEKRRLFEQYGDQLREFDRFASGGEIPIMAKAGEFVINKHAAGQIGYSNLEKLNRGGRVAIDTLEKLPKYHTGGVVQQFKIGGKIKKMKKADRALTKEERKARRDAYQADPAPTPFIDDVSHARINARAAATTNTSIGVSESRISPSTMGPLPAGASSPRDNTSILTAGLSAKPTRPDTGSGGQTRQQKFETDGLRVEKADKSQIKTFYDRLYQEEVRALKGVYDTKLKAAKAATAKVDADAKQLYKQEQDLLQKEYGEKFKQAKTPQEKQAVQNEYNQKSKDLKTTHTQKRDAAVSASQQIEKDVVADYQDKRKDIKHSVQSAALGQIEQTRQQRQENSSRLSPTTAAMLQAEDRRNKKTATRRNDATDNSLTGFSKGVWSGGVTGAAVGGLMGGAPGAALGFAVGGIGGAMAGSIDEKSNRIRAAQYQKTASNLKQKASHMAEGGSSGSAIVASLGKAFAPVVSGASKVASGMAKLHTGAAALAGGLSKASSGAGSFANMIRTDPAKAFKQALGSAVGSIMKLAKGADSAVGSLMGMKKVDLGGGKQGWRSTGNGIMGRVGGFFGMGGGGEMGEDGVTRGPDGRRKRGFGKGGRGRGGGGGGMGGMGMYMLEMGVSMAGSAGVEYLSRAAGGDKTKAGRQMSNIGGSMVSGASTGMMLGATLGSVIPGVGTVIGGAVGAGIGGVGGYLYGKSQEPEIERQADTQKRMETIEKARGKMSTDLAIAANTQAPEKTRKEAEARAQASFSTIASASKQEAIAGASKKERTWAEWSAGVGPSSAKTVDERVESAQPAADAAKEMLMTKMQKTGKTLEELESSMPKAEFNQLSEAIALTDKGYQSLLEAVYADGKATEAETKMLENAKKAAMERQGSDLKAAGEAAKAAKENAKVSQAAQKVVTSFERMAISLDAASARADKVMENGKLGIEAIDNPMAALQQGQISKSTDILSNPNAYSIQEVEQAARQNSGMAGSSSEAMVQSAVLPRKLEQSFGVAMQAAKAGGKDDTETRTSVKDAMNKTVEEAFGPDISAGMREKISEFIDNFKGDITQIDFNDLVKAVPELADKMAASGKVMDALKNQAQTAANAIAMMSDAAQKGASKDQEVRNNNADTFSTVANSTLAFRRGIGEKISWQADAGVRTQARAMRLGTTPDVAANPEAMLNRYNQLQTATQQASENQQRVNEANRPALMSGDQNAISGANSSMQAAANATAQFAQSTKQARDEIMALPNDIKENISGIMQELQDVMQERAAKLGAAGGFMEKVLTSTPQDLKKMGNTFNNLNRTLSGKAVSFQESYSANTAYNQVRKQGGSHNQAQRAAQEAYAQETGDTLSMAKELAPLLGAVDPTAQSQMMGSVYESMFAARGVDTSQMKIGDKSMKDYIEMMKKGPGDDPKVKALKDALSAQQTALEKAAATANTVLMNEKEEIIARTGTVIQDAMTQGAAAVKQAMEEAQIAGITAPGEVGKNKPGDPGKPPMNEEQIAKRKAENDAEIKRQKEIAATATDPVDKQDAENEVKARQQENNVLSGKAVVDNMNYAEHGLADESEEQFNTRKQKLYGMVNGVPAAKPTPAPAQTATTTTQAAANAAAVPSPQTSTVPQKPPQDFSSTEEPDWGSAGPAPEPATAAATQAATPVPPVGGPTPTSAGLPTVATPPANRQAAVANATGGSQKPTVYGSSNQDMFGNTQITDPGQAATQSAANLQAEQNVSGAVGQVATSIANVNSVPLQQPAQQTSGGGRGGPMGLQNVHREAYVRGMSVEQVREERKQQYLSRFNPEVAGRLAKKMGTTYDPTGVQSQRMAGMAGQPQATAPAGTGQATTVPQPSTGSNLPPQVPQPQQTQGTGSFTPPSSAGAPVSAPRQVQSSGQQNQGAGVLNTNGFEAFATKLDTLLTKLAEVNIPTEIRLTSENLGVNVTLNGGEVMANLPDSLRQSILQETAQQIANYDRGTTGEGAAQNSNIMGKA